MRPQEDPLSTMIVHEQKYIISRHRHVTSIKKMLHFVHQFSSFLHRYFPYIPLQTLRIQLAQVVIDGHIKDNHIWDISLIFVLHTWNQQCLYFLNNGLRQQYFILRRFLDIIITKVSCVTCKIQDVLIFGLSFGINNDFFNNVLRQQNFTCVTCKIKDVCIIQAFGIKELTETDSHCFRRKTHRICSQAEKPDTL